MTVTQGTGGESTSVLNINESVPNATIQPQEENLNYDEAEEGMNGNANGNIVVDDEEDEAYYENPIEVIREFGNHPLMERAQQALIGQLKETNYRQGLELKDKKDELKKLVNERESLGVQLYNLQQQLSRIQLLLENAHNEYNTLLDARLAEEEILKEVSKNNVEQKALYEEYCKQQKKHAIELESLNETIRQIETYNEQVKSEIAISRRAAYKVEQNMQVLEKEKEEQDYYVDFLNKKISKLTEEINFIGKQYAQQNNETLEANKILQETEAELATISHEKQQLMVQWKSALNGLSRRDEALAIAINTLNAAESAVHDYDVEIEASRRDLQREQARHETLVNLRDRMENELNWVEENLNRIRQEKAMMQERYNLLNKSLQQTDAEYKKLELVAKQLMNDIDIVIQNLQVVTQERQKMEEELSVLYSTYSNVNKAVNNLTKDQNKMVKHIHERENEAREIENEIARTKVERLNLTAINDSLKENLNAAMNELKDKENLIAKYQLEIRQRNDEIEKKMYRVDRLNKKYEKMVESAGGEENLGPLENTIKNLNKEIESITNECKEMEREWLRRQTEMVTLSADINKLQEKNNEQQARLTVLTQQQMRLLKDLRELKNNLKVARHSNMDYNKDISKLNALISVNHEQEHQLQGQNFILEMDCVEELKDAEKDCVQLQSQINELRNLKASLLDEIVETERQSMLWEKKIQLDKETRQALDPTIGLAESDAMEKEIHRMGLRLEALKREQERLSVEMERAVLKRATISTRYNAANTVVPPSSSKSASSSLSASAKANKELTQATAKKKIATLKREARLLAEETSEYNAQYEQKKSQLQQVAYDLEIMTAQYGHAEEMCHSLQGQINDALYQKQLLQERISYRQKFSARLRELTQSSKEKGVDLGQALPVERKLLSAVQAIENVKEIIMELISTYPHLKEVLERVLTMADADIDWEALIPQREDDENNANNGNFVSSESNNRQEIPL